MEKISDDELMMNCICEMIDRRKAFGLTPNRDRCNRFSPSKISGTPLARFELVQKLSLGFIE